MDGTAAAGGWWSQIARNNAAKCLPAQRICRNVPKFYVEASTKKQGRKHTWRNIRAFSREKCRYWSSRQPCAPHQNVRRLRCPTQKKKKTDDSVTHHKHQTAITMTLLYDALHAYLTPLLTKHASKKALVYDDLISSWDSAQQVLKLNSANSANRIVSVSLNG